MAVTLNPSLERNLTALLNDLGLKPAVQPTVSSDQTYSMITHYNLTDFDDAPRQPPQVIGWCPPMPNWNPWTGCNIDDGPMVSLCGCA